MQSHYQPGEAVIKLGGLFGLPGNNQRRARFVYQDVVYLVDDGVVQTALYALGQVVDHVVAQVVEAEFVVGAVGDVGLVGRAAVFGRHVVVDHARGQTQLFEYRAHPVAVAPGEIIVDRDYMHALAVESVQIGSQRRHVSLALAGLHLGHRAAVKNDPAHDLNVELAVADGPDGGFARRSERLGQEVVQGFAIGTAGLELGCKRSQLSVRERLHGRLQLVDVVDDGLEGLRETLRAVAQLFNPVKQAI